MTPIVYPRAQAGAVPPVLDARASDSMVFNQTTPSRLRATLPRVVEGSKIIMTPTSRMDALSEGRFLYENVGVVRGAVRTMSRYSLPLTPQAHTDDEGWNQASEEWWTEWCQNCEVTGQFHFDQLQRMLSESMDRDGDIGLVMRRTGLDWPQFQVVEGHRIGNRHGLYGDEGFIDGVRYTRDGRPLTYRVLDYDENRPQPFGGVVIGHNDIPAAAFILLFEPSRVDQGRGMTALYHALNHVKDIREILAFEKVGVKAGSAMPKVFHSDTGDADSREWAKSESDTGAYQAPFSNAQLESGLIPVIGLQERLEQLENNRPSPTFTGFLEFLIRDTAVGLGLPYEFVWNAERIGGAVTRLILAKAARRFAERRELFKRRLLNRAWPWVMSHAIKRRELTRNPKWLRVSWQSQADVTVDNGRDSAQERADVQAGLMTEAEHFGLRGFDWREQRQQREREVDDLLARAKAVASKHDVPLELALTLLSMRTPNGNPPTDDKGEKGKNDEPKK